MLSQTHRGIPHQNRSTISEVMEFRSAVLGFGILETIAFTEKSGHENGLKM